MTVFSGKVELGQGIVTAIAQIAAEELDVALERVRWSPATPRARRTRGTPPAASRSRSAAAAMRLACAEVRHLFLERPRAGSRWARRSCASATARSRCREPTFRTSYWELAPRVDLAREATGAVPPKPAAQRTHRRHAAQRGATSAPSSPARPTCTTSSCPAWCIGRVLRPPSYTARLQRFDAEAVRALPGVVAVVVSGRLHRHVRRARGAGGEGARGRARARRWEERAASARARRGRELLPQLPSARRVVHQQGAPAAGVAQRLEATYSKPYIAHASIGPSCALARFDGGRLTDVVAHAGQPFRCATRSRGCSACPTTTST